MNSISLVEFFEKHGPIKFSFSEKYNVEEKVFVNYIFSSIEDMIESILEINENNDIFYYRIDDVIMKNFLREYAISLNNNISKIKIINNEIIGSEIIQKYFILMRSKYLSAFARTGFTVGGNAVPALTSTLMQNSMSSAKKSGSSESVSEKSSMTEFKEILKASKNPKNPIIEATFVEPKTVLDVFELRSEYNHLILDDLVISDDYVIYESIKNEKWIHDYINITGVPIDLEEIENFLVLNLDKQLLYNYNISPFRIVKKISEQNKLNFAKMIPSYFHEAKILVIPDASYDDDSKLYGEILPKVLGIELFGIHWIKQVYPLLISLWQTLSKFEEIEELKYQTKRNVLSKKLNVTKEHYFKLFEFVKFYDIEFDGDFINFKSNNDPSVVRDTFEKYFVKRNLEERIIMLFKENPRKEYDDDISYLSYDKIEANILRITERNIEDFLSSRGAENMNFIDGGGIEYQNNINLEEFLSKELIKPSIYENVSNFVYIRIELKFKDKRHTTEETIYGLANRKEIYENNIWSDNYQAIVNVFGIEVARYYMLTKIESIQSTGGKLAFQRKHIEEDVNYVTKDESQIKTVDYKSSIGIREQSFFSSAVMADPGRNLSLSAAFGSYEEASKNVNMSSLVGGLAKIGTVAERISKGEHVERLAIKIDRDQIQRLSENPNEWDDDNMNGIIRSYVTDVEEDGMKFGPDYISSIELPVDERKKTYTIEQSRINRRKFIRKNIKRSKPSYPKLKQNPFEIENMNVISSPSTKIPDLY